MAKKKPKPSYQERLVAGQAMRQKIKDDREARRATRRDEFAKQAEFRARWKVYSTEHDRFMDNMLKGVLPVYEELQGTAKEVVDDYLRMKNTTWAALKEHVDEITRMRQERAEQREKQDQIDVENGRRAMRRTHTTAAMIAGIGMGITR